MHIRNETVADYGAVRAIHDAAFGQTLEGDLVDALRASQGMLSLVAERAGQVVGHILFTQVSLENASQVVWGLGLGPMAVAPEYQRRGVGSALVSEGLSQLREAGCPFAIVLGHPEYYPRFGFLLASGFGITSQWEGVPDAAFMIMVFDESALPAGAAIAYYRPEFDQAV